MTVKVELANDGVEFVETNQYNIGDKLHPMVVRITVYNNQGKKIATKKRPFISYYKKVTFKTAAVQDEIKRLDAEIQEQMKKMQQGIK